MGDEAVILPPHTPVCWVPYCKTDFRSPTSGAWLLSLPIFKDETLKPSHPFSITQKCVCVSLGTSCLQRKLISSLASQQPSCSCPRALERGQAIQSRPPLIKLCIQGDW
ncbi:unnamed protein product [Leuciscus chuanchicus]